MTKVTWKRSLLTLGCLALLAGCGKELAFSDAVPTDEVRQQYEIQYTAGAKEARVRAYFLRDPKDSSREQQILLRKGSSVKVNGLAMREVTPERKKPKENEYDLSDVGYYELTLPMPLDAVEFTYVDQNGKTFRNRIALPAVTQLTDLGRPIVSGKPFALRFRMPPKAEVDTGLGGILAGFSYIAPEKDTLSQERVSEAEADPSKAKLKELMAQAAIGRVQEASLDVEFGAAETVKLRPGAAFLTYGYAVKLPLPEPTKAQGGFVRVHFQAQAVPVTIVRP